MPNDETKPVLTEDEATGTVLGLLLGLYERFGRGLAEFSPAIDLLPSALAMGLRSDDVVTGLCRLARAGYVSITSTDFMLPEDKLSLTRGGLHAFDRYFAAKRAGTPLPELPDEVQDPAERQSVTVNMLTLNGGKTRPAAALPGPAPREVEGRGRTLPFKPGEERL